MKINKSFRINQVQLREYIEQQYPFLKGKVYTLDYAKNQYREPSEPLELEIKWVDDEWPAPEKTGG